MNKYHSDIESLGDFGTLREHYAAVASGPGDLVSRTRFDDSFLVPLNLEVVGQRNYIHQRDIPVNDQAVEISVDRVYPFTGDPTIDPTEAGLLIGWKVSAKAPEVLLVNSASNALLPPQLEACILSEDTSLGDSDHYRLIVDDDEIKVIQMDNLVETTLFSHTIASTIRRVGLRAALVDGELLFWWNPDGEFRFDEKPIFRHFMLKTGTFRTGFTLGHRGSILKMAHEYGITTIGTPIAIRSVIQEELNLVPVRATLSYDESRPPVRLNIVVTEHGDTKIPERQQRESRVFLHDARFMLRPGHRYRISGSFETVDGDDIRIQGVEFTVTGTRVEDIRNTDDDGTLILHEDDGIEIYRSDLASFDTKLEPASSIGVSVVPIEDGDRTYLDHVTRPMQQSSRTPRVFALTLIDVTDAQLEQVRVFFSKARLRKLPFVWKHPTTGEAIAVYYNKDNIEHQTGENGHHSIDLEFEEAFNIPVGTAFEVASVAAQPDECWVEAVKCTCEESIFPEEGAGLIPYFHCKNIDHLGASRNDADYLVVGAVTPDTGLESGILELCFQIPFSSGGAVYNKIATLFNTLPVNGFEIIPITFYIQGSGTPGIDGVCTDCVGCGGDPPRGGCQTECQGNSCCICSAVGVSVQCTVIGSGGPEINICVCVVKLRKSFNYSWSGCSGVPFKAVWIDPSTGFAVSLNLDTGRWSLAVGSECTPDNPDADGPVIRCETPEGGENSCLIFDETLGRFVSIVPDAVHTCTNFISYGCCPFGGTNSGVYVNRRVSILGGGCG